MDKTTDPLPPARVGRLDTAFDVRRELARLYRAGRRGELPASDASKLGSILGLILRSIEATDIEQRLDRLENRE